MVDNLSLASSSVKSEPKKQEELLIKEISREPERAKPSGISVVDEAVKEVRKIIKTDSEPKKNKSPE